MKREARTVSRVVLGALLAFAASPPLASGAPTQVSSTAIIEAVHYCLDQVHAHVAPPGAEVYVGGHEWANFDAYYNPATHKVIDNVTMSDGDGPRFLFAKCLSERGYSLTK